MKKKLSVTAIVGTVAIGGTLAFLTASDEAVNKINVADSDDLVDLEEPEWDPDEDDDEPMFPGDTKYKDPTVTTKSNVYARVKMTFTDKTTGATITDGERLDLIWDTIKYDPNFKQTNAALVEGQSYTQAEVEALCDDAVAEEDRVTTVNYSKFSALADNGTDGAYYFYFTGGTSADGEYIFTKDDGSVTLFNNIVIPSDWDNYGQNDGNGKITTLGKFNIVVEVQSIQQTNNEETFDTLADFASWFNDNYFEPDAPEEP